MQVDKENIWAYRVAIEVDQRDADEPEFDQDVLKEFLANPEAFVTQTNSSIRSVEHLNASLCYDGPTAPEAYLNLPQRERDREWWFSAKDFPVFNTRGFGRSCMENLHIALIERLAIDRAGPPIRLHGNRKRLYREPTLRLPSSTIQRDEQGGHYLTQQQCDFILNPGSPKSRRFKQAKKIRKNAQAAGIMVCAPCCNRTGEVRFFPIDLMKRTSRPHLLCGTICKKCHSDRESNYSRAGSASATTLCRQAIRRAAAFPMAHRLTPAMVQPLLDRRSEAARTDSVFRMTAANGSLAKTRARLSQQLRLFVAPIDFSRGLVEGNLVLLTETAYREQALKLARVAAEFELNDLGVPQLSDRQKRILLNRARTPNGQQADEAKLLADALIRHGHRICGECQKAEWARNAIVNPTPIESIHPLGLMRKQKKAPGGYQTICKACYARMARDDARDNVARTVWRRAQRRAGGSSFKITVQDVQNLIDTAATVDAPFGRCPITRDVLVIGEKKPHRNSLSLDRIIPKFGYVPGNVALLSFAANTAKGNRGIEPFSLLNIYLSRAIFPVGSQQLSNIDVDRWKIQKIGDVLRSSPSVDRAALITIDSLIAIQYCPCCKVEIDYSRKTKGVRKSNSPALDRRNPKKLYVNGNCFSICWGCNSAKHGLTPAEIDRMHKWLRTEIPRARGNLLLDATLH
jgi:hypothetical protein